MTNLKYLLLFSVLISGLLFGLYIYPYVKYVAVLSGKSPPEWFKLSKPIHRGHFNLVDSEVLAPDKEYETLWKRFPVGTFRTPLPVHHPEYLVIPSIETTSAKTRPRFGFQYSDTSSRGIVKIFFLNPMRFRRSLNSQWLFRIPLIQEYLREHAPANIWKDMFLRDLKKWKVSLFDLAYNSYILFQRSRNFPSRIDAFSYYPEKKMVIFKYPGSNPDVLVEMVQILGRGNILYRYMIKTRTSDERAKQLRLRILRDIEVYNAPDDITERLYTDFKSLNFKEQIDQEGMFYLFSAWTYQWKSRDFLREAIQFLERGKDNLPLLDPLYSYAYKNFGTSFSLIDEKLKETEAEKLKRKLEEEAAEERRKEAANELSDIEIEQLSEDQRIDYMLRNAKDNETQEEDVLRFD